MTAATTSPRLRADRPARACRQRSKNYGWASMGGSILSELGTLHMEFAYLSDVTGEPVFADRVRRVRELLARLEPPGGLFPNYLHPVTGDWGERE